MKPAAQYSVVVEKQPGCRIVFSTRNDRAAAELVVTRLAAIGCMAHVLPMQAPDFTGMHRRSRTA